MIEVKEALRIVLENTSTIGIEEIAIDEAVGRVLAQEIVADRDFPPYDRVTMDGIALRKDQFDQGQRTFPIEGIAPAGAEQQSLKSIENCLEVMTGSVFPLGVDVVIRYEDLDIKEGVATVKAEQLIARQNVHGQGEDLKEGQVILSAGRVITAAEIGICASVGQYKIEVERLPKALIISTGDELVEIDETPEPHQIRMSNVFQLQAMLKSYGIEADRLHLVDNLEEIQQKLSNAIEDYDVLLISGGVSKGKFDFLPRALKEVGVKQLFHKVLQRPGKPFWFGQSEKCKVFAFPGNPISSFMCAQYYLKAWLIESLGVSRTSKVFARLTKDVAFKPDLTYFLEVQLNCSKEGVLEASPAKGNGSGDLTNLVNVDGFLKLPRGKELFEAGEVFEIIQFRNSF